MSLSYFQKNMDDIRHIPVTLSPSELPKAALKIVENLRDGWKSQEIKFKVFTDGYTNKLIGCYSEKNPDEMILVRVYGDKTDLFINRETEFNNFKLMHREGYAPKIYATFENGMVYDYIPGEVLNINTCTDEKVYPLVSRMLAKMHKLSYNGSCDGTKVPFIWQKIEQLIDLIPECFSTTEKQSRFCTYFSGGKIALRKQLKELRNVLGSTDNPVVFCHNDLLLANVIYRKNMDAVMFIDYEYAAYNYQAFDIANHFAEFAGVTVFDPTQYPSEEFQRNWIREYLKEYTNSSTVNEQSVQKLFQQVVLFSPLPHFLWTMWALVQSYHSAIDFDYLEYAILRHKEYEKFVRSSIKN